MVYQYPQKYFNIDIAADDITQYFCVKNFCGFHCPRKCFTDEIFSDYDSTVKVSVTPVVSIWVVIIDLIYCSQCMLLRRQ